MTAYELRIMFKNKYPDIDKIKKSELYRLIYLLQYELENNKTSVTMYINPINNFVDKMIIEKGLSYKGLEITVRSHYFNNREAITFNKDGNVYFCGWAGGTNPIPFLKAFERWLIE